MPLNLKINTFVSSLKSRSINSDGTYMYEIYANIRYLETYLIYGDYKFDLSLTEEDIEKIAYGYITKKCKDINFKKWCQPIIREWKINWILKCV